jgi:integrase
MGRRPTTGGVKPAGDRIEIRFTWRRKDLRPTLPLKPTAANLKHAARLRADVLAEIRAGTFVLDRYFPDYKFADRHVVHDAKKASTFGQWAQTWEKLATRGRAYATQEIYKVHLRAYFTSVWGLLPATSITHEMVLTRLAELCTDREEGGRQWKALGPKTQNNIMIPLRAVFRLVCRANPGFTDPTDDIVNVKLQEPRPDPFDAGEVNLLVAKLRETQPELADYFEFACFAGLRPSEQIALLWQDIDLRTMTVHVQRARVMRRDKATTKTYDERAVELNLRAAAALQRQRARTQLAGGHVFLDPILGEPWADGEVLRLAWEQVQRRCGIRYRPPKECRDTSVSLALAAGADPVWVARQHGHGVMVMMKSYARWIPKADAGRNLKAVNAALDAPPSETATNPR